MTKKFTYTLEDKLKSAVKNVKDNTKIAARDIKDNTVLAYDVKRKDIEDNVIPKSLLTVLTPEEIARSQRIGLFVGFVVLIAIIFCVIWFFWGHLFQ